MLLADEAAGLLTASRDDMGSIVTFPAGWALRHFGLDQFTRLVEAHRPPLVEISKDFLNDRISLKELAGELDRLRGTARFDLCFAGTTDLASCAGFEWERYRDYVAVQVAQARFLGCGWFRLLLGEPSSKVPAELLVERTTSVCNDLKPIRACVEIHGGIESDPDWLAAILEQTAADVVVDLENMRRVGLSAADLQAVLPPGRIAYFHVRNLVPTWVEHPATLEDAATWDRYRPGGVFLWEPKTVDAPELVEEKFVEYQTLD